MSFMNLRTDFNTSYVVIKRDLDKGELVTKNNFNTSYVVIKPYCLFMANFSDKISIHLMLLLNSCPMFSFYFMSSYFNTSYVVIKPLVNKPLYMFYYTSKPLYINTFLFFYQLYSIFNNFI